MGSNVQRVKNATNSQVRLGQSEQDAPKPGRTWIHELLEQSANDRMIWSLDTLSLAARVLSETDFETGNGNQPVRSGSCYWFARVAAGAQMRSKAWVRTVAIVKGSLLSMSRLSIMNSILPSRRSAIEGEDGA
jgi:hypothetical protein